MSILDVSHVVGYQLQVTFHDWMFGVSWSSSSDPGNLCVAYEEPGFTIGFLVNQDSLSSWTCSIPEEVLEKTLEFECQFAQFAFCSLWFTSRSLAARELLLDAPILVWMIIFYSIKNNLKPGEALKLFELKRTEILGLYGLPKKNLF